jgi:hypothetical protein
MYQSCNIADWGGGGHMRKCTVNTKYVYITIKLVSLISGGKGSKLFIYRIRPSNYEISRVANGFFAKRIDILFM